MNSMLSRKAAGLAGVTFSLLALPMLAGPGSQYWRKPSEPAPAVTPATGCPGSTEVALTVMKPAWPNGRGPLTPVQIGTKRVCTICPVTAVKTIAQPNGRGPQTRIETAPTGAPHDCTAECPVRKG